MSRMPVLIMTLLSLFFSVKGYVANLDANMVNKIAVAKKNLATTETQINQASVKLAKQLSELEQQVIALRNKTAVARRKMDERTLGLAQLESRLSSWEKQQSFQQNLLDRFLQQQGLGFSQLNTMSFDEKLLQVENELALLDQAATPNWQKRQLVLPSGEVIQTHVMSMGPVNWFFDESLQKAGLANMQNDLLTAQVNFDGSRYQQVERLFNTDQGELILDPTLGRAITKQQSNESPIEHVLKGGIWVAPIVIFALISTIICLLKVVQLWRLPQIVRVTSLNTIDALAVTFKGMQKSLFNIAQQESNNTQRDDQLFMQLQQDKHQLEKWTNVITVTAAVAPLLGLLGTVSGMIETFRMMTAFGSSDPEVISGGIAKALVTTELGLVVAIPALILSTILSRKAKRYYDGLESFALILSNEPLSDKQTDNNVNSEKQEAA